jgi:hypothetical protein
MRSLHSNRAIKMLGGTTESFHYSTQRRLTVLAPCTTRGGDEWLPRESKTHHSGRHSGCSR